MCKLTSAVLGIFCFALLSACSSVPAEPDTGGLATEEGLRLSIYSIGAEFDNTLPLQPGQSPNVDMTVAGVAVGADASFRDEQEITEDSDEVIDNFYIAEWSGWIQVQETSLHAFQIVTEAQADLVIDGQQVAGRVQLEAGWHSIQLTQRVQSADQRAIELHWVYGSDALVAESYINWPPIPTENLRAPAFYFRPTQAGFKTLADGSDRPGLGQKLTTVHPGYRLTNIRPDGMEMPVGGLGMLSDGRLAVARFDATTLTAPSPTEEPNGQLWLLSNPTADDPADVTGELIADGLFEPSGLYVIDDQIYVSQRREISRFTFNDSTGAWDKDVIASGWITNDFHQISAGLPWLPGPTEDHPGFFYMTRGAGLGKGQNPPDHASVWLIDLSLPAGENVIVLTGGHRTPNGIGLNTEGEAFVIDNQGGWTPANELNHVRPGRFYGYYLRNNPPNANRAPFQPATIPEEGEDPETSQVMEAAVKLPQDEIGNSPTQPLLFPQGSLFEGQFALGDMRYGGVNRVFLEKIGDVNGVWQGCAMRFTQGLEAGPNRIFFGPDGSLYVGGIGGNHASTWYWNNLNGEPTFQGLERLTPTGAEVFEIHHMRATPDGFVLQFTQPVDRQTLEDPATYAVQQWTYLATRRYGGPKIDQQEMQVTEAVASEDGLSVRLTIPNLNAGYVVYLRTDPVSTQGQAIWSGEVWYTLNAIPE